MSRAARFYLAGCAFALAFAIGYALPAFAPVPNAYYDPLLRRFTIGQRPGSLAMGYYGQTLWGLATGAAFGALTYAAAGRRARDPEPATVGLMAAWAVSALMLVGAYFTWNNWP